MTLIVGAANPNFALQVCDRRVTMSPTGEFVTDDAIKMVAFCNQMVFSFTGLAVMDGKKTVQWLSDELASLATHDLKVACEHVRRRATER